MVQNHTGRLRRSRPAVRAAFLFILVGLEKLSNPGYSCQQFNKEDHGRSTKPSASEPGKVQARHGAHGAQGSNSPAVLKDRFPR